VRLEWKGLIRDSERSELWESGVLVPKSSAAERVMRLCLFL
jgi:hypothetical protein